MTGKPFLPFLILAYIYCSFPFLAHGQKGRYTIKSLPLYAPYDGTHFFLVPFAFEVHPTHKTGIQLMYTQLATFQNVTKAPSKSFNHFITLDFRRYSKKSRVKAWFTGMHIDRIILWSDVKTIPPYTLRTDIFGIGPNFGKKFKWSKHFGLQVWIGASVAHIVDSGSSDRYLFNTYSGYPKGALLIEYRF